MKVKSKSHLLGAQNLISFVSDTETNKSTWGCSATWFTERENKINKISGTKRIKN